MATKRQCRATSTTTGEQCKRAAIKGGVVCHMHGGAAPQVKAAAKRRLALEEARQIVSELSLGTEVETTPEEAILAQVWEAAGNVAVLRGLVEQLEVQFGKDGIAGLTGNEKKWNEAAPHIFVTMYGEERDRLVRVSKIAAEIGLSERMVRIVEQQAELMVRVFSAALDDDEWGLTREQRQVGRKILGRHLKAV